MGWSCRDPSICFAAVCDLVYDSVVYDSVITFKSRLRPGDVLSRIMRVPAAESGKRSNSLTEFASADFSYTLELKAATATLCGFRVVAALTPSFECKLRTKVGQVGWSPITKRDAYTYF